MVVLFPGQVDQGVDLLGNVNFLLVRELDRLLRVFEFRLRRINGRYFDNTAGVDHVLHEAKGVTFFLLGLFQKMLRQLRQGLRREIGADREILKRSAELVTDLFVDCVDDLMACEHGRFYPVCASAPVWGVSSLDERFPSLPEADFSVRPSGT